MQFGEGHCRIYSLHFCKVNRRAAPYNAICNLVKDIAAYTVRKLVNYIEVQHPVMRYAIWRRIYSMQSCEVYIELQHTSPMDAMHIRLHTLLTVTGVYWVLGLSEVWTNSQCIFIYMHKYCICIFLFWPHIPRTPSCLYYYFYKYNWWFSLLSEAWKSLFFPAGNMKECCVKNACVF